MTYFHGPADPDAPAADLPEPDTFVAVDPAPVTVPLVPDAPVAARPRVRKWASPAFWLAVAQAVLVCGIPTQLTIAVVLMVGAGMQPFDGTSLSLEFFATLSLFDTAVVALLIRVFLIFSGENSRDVFFGRRPIGGEVLRGVLFVPVVLIMVTAIVVCLRTVAPWMHTVTQSPLEAFMRTPLDSAIFLVVVVLAGGVREELQRAFILHRFRQHLGGIRLGLVIFSGTFGLMHLDQGVDVAIAIGLLGLFWGVLYAKRRSAVMPMVNHAGFNAAQVAQQLIARSLGI